MCSIEYFYFYLDRTTHFSIWSIQCTDEVESKIWVILKEASDGCSKMKCVCLARWTKLAISPSPELSLPCPAALPNCTCTPMYLGIPVPAQCTHIHLHVLRFFLYLHVPAQRTWLHQSQMYPNLHVPSLTSNTGTCKPNMPALLKVLSTQSCTWIYPL